jgi:hypothetical protein
MGFDQKKLFFLFFFPKIGSKGSVLEGCELLFFLFFFKFFGVGRLKVDRDTHFPRWDLTFFEILFLFLGKF